MARLAGVDLPRDKRVEIALTYIYGIGDTSAKKIVAGGQREPATPVSGTWPRRRSPGCARSSSAITAWKATCAARWR